jgi:NADPH:quinone reductase-like Zn-dependent oxidoreductase
MGKVVRFHRTGGPETLQLDDLPIGAPGAGEVRIKVAAIGLNRVESMFRSGAFGCPVLPSRLGYEAAGIIDALGEGVGTFHIGDRVAILPGLSMEQYGAYTEALVYPASMLIRQPDNVTLEQAAAAWMQYLTAYALIGVSDLRAGDTVVITAASSSVGLAAIQIANAVEACPIAVTRGRSKIEALRGHGAAHVIASDDENPVAAVMRLTNGQGARVVFDAVGGEGLGTWVEAICAQGYLIVYGSLRGDVAHIPLSYLMLKGVTLHGFAMNEFISVDTQREAAVRFVHGGLSSGKLRPVIDRVFRLDEIVQAHRYLEGNTQIGKILART